MSQLPPELPGIDYRAEGRIAIDRFVRGTALLPTSGEKTGWIQANLDKFEAAMAEQGDDVPDHLAAFAEGFREAAKEALADLIAYKANLYGWK
jgi:hypothetical protein